MTPEKLSKPKPNKLRIRAEQSWTGARMADASATNSIVVVHRQMPRRALLSFGASAAFAVAFEVKH